MKDKWFNRIHFVVEVRDCVRERKSCWNDLHKYLIHTLVQCCLAVCEECVTSGLIRKLKG